MNKFLPTGHIQIATITALRVGLRHSEKKWFHMSRNKSEIMSILTREITSIIEGALEANRKISHKQGTSELYFLSDFLMGDLRGLDVPFPLKTLCL